MFHGNSLIRVATGSEFLIGRTELEEMTLSGYAMIRYMNQLPATQTLGDHFGNGNVIDPRNDIQFHRATLNFREWLFSPSVRRRKHHRRQRRRAWERAHVREAP